MAKESNTTKAQAKERLNKLLLAATRRLVVMDDHGNPAARKLLAISLPHCRKAAIDLTHTADDRAFFAELVKRIDGGDLAPRAKRRA